MGRNFLLAVFFWGGGEWWPTICLTKLNTGAAKLLICRKALSIAFCRDHFFNFGNCKCALKSDKNTVGCNVISQQSPHLSVCLVARIKRDRQRRQPKSQPFNKICDFTRNLRFNPKIRLDISLHLNRHVCRYTRLQNMVHIRNNHQLRIRTSLLQ